MPIPPGSPAPPGSPPGPALLAFFTSSSSTCALAFPVFGELRRRYGDVLPVIAVAQDPEGKAEPWLEEKAFNGPVIDDSEGYTLSDGFDVEVVPTLVLVEGGRVLAVSEGWDRARVNRWDELLARYTGRCSEGPVSPDDDGRPVTEPGSEAANRRSA
ncbi:MAG: TlpA family protein disulfide reductase [Acidimicrobiales bacterium]